MEPFLYYLIAAIPYFVICQNAATPDERLRRAAESGDLAAAQKAIAEGASVSAKDSFGWTPLHLATLKDNTEVAKVIMKAGADLNAKRANKGNAAYEGESAARTAAISEALSKGKLYLLESYDDWTPIHFIYSNQNVALVKAMLAAGYDMKAKNEKGYSHFHEALAQGNIQILKAFLDAGADVNAESDDGKRAMDVAISLGHDEFLPDLLLRGGKPKLESSTFHIYQNAIKNKAVELVDAMAEDPDYPVNVRDASGFTPLHTAAELGNVEIIKSLIKRGANPKAKNEAGFTPLHTAASVGEWDAAKALIDAGVDVNAQSNDGQTSVDTAVASGHDDMIADLLVAGAEPHLDATKFHILSIVIASKNVDSLNVLLKAGYKVDMVNSAGSTPLHIAATKGSVAIVKALLDAGADVNAKSEDGLRPMDLAADAVYPSMDELLPEFLKHGAKSDKQSTHMHLFKNAINNRNVETVKYLIKGGFDVNANSGTTPLHEASRIDEVEIAKVLIEAGADVNAKDSAGYTPLDTTKYYSPRVADFLAANGGKSGRD